MECLESLFCSEGAEFVAVVCDNGSADDSLAQLRSWAACRFTTTEWVNLTRAEVGNSVTLKNGIHFVLIENSANLGFAAGNNVGIQLAMNHADCKYAWLLNNDTTVEPSALAHVVARMEEDSRIGICGSTLIYHGERDMVQALSGAHYYPLTGRSVFLGAFSELSKVPDMSDCVEAQLSFVAGAAMLVRRAFIEKVGYMMEDYFLYYEEIDWATRGAKYFRLGYAPRSVVYHKEGASIGTSPYGGSPLSMYYLYRNRMWFTKRYHPLYLPTVLISCFWDILKLLLKGKMQLARASFRGVSGLKLPTPNIASGHR